MQGGLCCRGLVQWSSREQLTMKRSCCRLAELCLGHMFSIRCLFQGLCSKHGPVSQEEEQLRCKIAANVFEGSRSFFQFGGVTFEQH
jgi:hypothetical protein